MLSAAAQRQIRKSELIWDRQKDVRCERELKSTSEWKEDSDGIMAARIERNLHTQRNHEIGLLNKELVMVRRAALKKVLHAEHQQYKEELNQQGKTFYIQRL